MKLKAITFANTSAFSLEVEIILSSVISRGKRGFSRIFEINRIVVGKFLFSGTV